MQFELVRFGEFIAGIDFGFKNSEVGPNHHDLVKERFERHILWLERRIRRLHEQRSVLPAVGEAFDDHVFFFQSERLDGGQRGFTNQA
ncbi:MAG: hypothetical protein QOJ64_2155, partial [Acidobacteriota bacterium]|nr:hypothetical protein [Acidobacteriota bacterium]